MEVSKVKRIAVFLACAGCVFFVLTGTAFASGSSEAKSASAATGQSITGQTIIVQFTTPAPPQALLDQFKKETGVSINWVNLGWPELQTKITAAAAANTYFADATDVDWSRVGEFARTKWFIPLNKYINPDTVKADVPQLATFLYKGELVGMPVDASSLVTTVNVSDFQKAGITGMPKTFQEYSNDLKKIQQSGVNPHPLGIGLSAVEGLSTNWYELTAAFGGNVLSKDLNPLFADPQSAGYRALQWLVDAYKSGLIPAGDLTLRNGQVMQTEMAMNLVSSVFADFSGNIATIYAVPSQSKVVGQIRYIPTPGENGPAPNLGNPDGMGIPAAAKYPDAAGAFIKWLTSTQVQTDITGGGDPSLVVPAWPLPMRLSAMEALTKTNDQQTQTSFLISLFKKYSQPVFPEGAPPWYAKFSHAAYTNINAAIAGNETVDQAIQAIVRTVKSLNS